MSIARDLRCWLPLTAVPVLSAIGALTSWSAAGRSDVWKVLPIAAVWGLVAVLGGARMPRTSAAWVVAAAFLVRVPWVGSPPHLSDDLYRYLWEGLALSAGHDPFAVAPADLGGLDDHLRSLVNHPELTSVYPPLALWWFRLLAVGGTPAWAQLLTACVDACTAGVLLRASRRPAAAWIYALHPLPVLESACGAHIDVPAVFLAALAVLALRRDASAVALWATVAGAATKLFPVVMLPAVLRRLPPARAAVHLLAAGMATALLAVPLVHLGPGLLSSARLYAGTWSFLGFAWPWLDPVLGGATRPVLVGIGALVVGTATWRARDPLEVWAAAGTAFVLLSPTVHPWYVLWALVPSLLLGRAGWALAAIGSLQAYAVLATWDAATASWAEQPWLWWWVWGNVLAGLAAGRWIQLRSDDEPTIVYPVANKSRNGNDAQ
ncbi:MAG: hypothetical protein H6738_04760 [Alphaproteobacteria bacterium]|nr:hypothetical protein [Alphaproteobacteria bacterium]MCB9696084.1 hypothetical protein [Alphaproteobacteria bacterium]